MSYQTIKMKIDKITFKNSQAWAVITSDNIEKTYIGTWHIVDPETVELLRKDMPEEIFFRDKETDKVIKEMVEEIRKGIDDGQ